MANHTKGTWIYHAELGEIYHDDLNQVLPLIATVNFANTSKEVADADGRLMAAAPDLLEALKRAEAYISNLSGGGNVDFRAELQAVIDMATGTTPIQTLTQRVAKAMFEYVRDSMGGETLSLHGQTAWVANLPQSGSIDFEELARIAYHVIWKDIAETK